MTAGAVSQWLKRGEAAGSAALGSRRGGGPKPRLNGEQLAELRTHLSKGAEQFGFGGEVWTQPRVAALIKRIFGVSYHSAPVGRLLKKLGWSGQKPVTRASQRNEAVIEHWRTETWLELEKAQQEGRTIVFIDEAGFYRLPAGVWTDAPRGQTPILRLPLTRDHLSAISAVTPDGKLYMRVQDGIFKGPAIVRFLPHLLRPIPGKLLIIWDGLPAHRGQEVKTFLAQGATQRIRLEPLPGYAPDLNPDEGIWRYLKYVEMKNLCCHPLAELRYEWRKALARLQHRTEVILACFQQVRLGVQV